MLYVAGADLEKLGSGVVKKVVSQMNAFCNSGLNCTFYKLTYCNESNVKNKFFRRVPFYNVHKHWRVNDFANEKNIYVRNLGPWDRYAVKFFQAVKEVNPRVKIVYELPTYPYDGELVKNWKDWPLLIKDRYNRRNIHKCVDRIATLTDDKEIFGVPTLKIGNGIDVDKIRPRQVRDTDEVHAIAVANFRWWHGYDRFLEGMKDYYAARPKRKVIFHLVGQGSEFGCYQKIVADYELGDYVVFHGQQTGEALDKIYDECNLGIASLGSYRKGLNETQELKSREYLAKGIPFVASVRIADIPDEDKENIYLQVPNNDSPIEIECVLKFFDQIYSERAEQVNIRLRQFAKDHFSMEAMMKEVIRFFKEGK